MNYVLCHFQFLGPNNMASRNLLAILLLASICMAQAYPALLPYIYSEYRTRSHPLTPIVYPL